VQLKASRVSAEVASRRLDDDGFGSAHSSVAEAQSPSQPEVNAAVIRCVQLPRFSAYYVFESLYCINV